MGLNLANCSTQGNFGSPACAAIPSYIRYIVLVPKATTVAASAFLTQAAWVAAVKAGMWNDSRASRWQFLPALSEFKDKSKDTVTVEKDNRIIKVVETPYVFMWEFWQGSTGVTKCMHGNLYKYVDSQMAVYDVFLVDDNNMWWFTQGSTTGEAASLTLTSIIIGKWKQNNLKDGNVFPIEISLGDPSQLNDGFAFYQSTTPASYFQSIGLVDVQMTAGVTTPNSTTHIYVSGTVGCGSTSLGAAYGTALDVAALWAVNDVAGGGAVVPSAVSYNATLDQYDLTGTFTTGHSYLVGLAVPSVTTAAGIYAITETANKIVSVIP